MRWAFQPLVEPYTYIIFLLNLATYENEKIKTAGIY